MEIDPEGAIYVSGATGSADFPTRGAFQGYEGVRDNISDQARRAPGAGVPDAPASGVPVGRPEIRSRPTLHGQAPQSNGKDEEQRGEL